MGYVHFLEPLPKWLMGSLSIPFLLSLHQVLPGVFGRWLTFIGGYTLAIYLMNTIFIGVAKAALLPVVPYREHYFFIYFAVLILAGLLAPILLKRVLLRQWPGLARYL